MKFSSILLSVLSTFTAFSIGNLAQAKPQAILDLSKVPVKGKSVIWSPLFQATWDNLNGLHKGKPVTVGQQNKLILALDSYQWDEEKVMPKGGYATYAGPATKEFVDSTAAAIKKEFKVNMQPNEIPLSPTSHAAFGILIRDLKFKRPFIKSKNNPLAFVDSFSDTYKVQFFGTAKKYSGYYRQSVAILSYKNKGKEFAISIATKTPDEKVIIYRPSKMMSMEAAMKEVKQSIDKPLNGKFDSLDDPRLHRDDVVKIPYIAFKSETDFTSRLKGLRFFEGDPTPWRINAAKQFTQFELHEKGARIRMDTQGGGEPFGEPPKPKPRNFVCDRPFYVFLWKDKAPIPYFALWVDSVDVLKRFQ